MLILSKLHHMKLRFLSLLALAALAAPFASHAEGPSQLPANARVAIIGDSITEQKIYSKFIETYLLACLGRKDIACFQFGWVAKRQQHSPSVSKMT